MKTAKILYRENFQLYTVPNTAVECTYLLVQIPIPIHGSNIDFSIIIYLILIDDLEITI